MRLDTCMKVLYIDKFLKLCCCDRVGVLLLRRGNQYWSWWYPLSLRFGRFYARYAAAALAAPASTGLHITSIHHLHEKRHRIATAWQTVNERNKSDILDGGDIELDSTHEGFPAIPSRLFSGTLRINNQTINFKKE